MHRYNPVIKDFKRSLKLMKWISLHTAWWHTPAFQVKSTKHKFIFNPICINVYETNRHEYVYIQNYPEIYLRLILVDHWIISVLPKLLKSTNGNTNGYTNLRNFGDCFKNICIFCLSRQEFKRICYSAVSHFLLKRITWSLVTSRISNFFLKATKILSQLGFKEYAAMEMTCHKKRS